MGFRWFDYVAKGGKALLCSLALLAAATASIGTAYADEWADSLAQMLSDSKEFTSDELTPVPGEAIVVFRTDASARSARTLDDAATSLFADAGYTVEGTVDLSAPDELATYAADSSGDSEGADTSLPQGADLCVALVSREGADTDALVAELEEIEGVELAAPNYRRSIASVPNDTLYGLQYGMHDSSASDGGAGISLPTALDKDAQSSDARDNIVAVLDTGVDYTHPDLQDVMWSDPGDLGLPSTEGACGYDVADGDSDPMPVRYFATSHGTHCAGAIAAATNNNEGVTGVAQHTKIMAVKISSDDDASGSFSDFDLVAGYGYVIQAAVAGENVVAISGSWHVGPYSPVIDYAINQAGKAGVMSILAAGNDGVDLDDSTIYGATVHIESPYAIIVAASNRDNELAAFSNWNATDVDIAAAGAYDLSCVSTEASASFFNAELSHEAGKDLGCYDELGKLYTQGKLSVALYDAMNPGAPVDQELADRALHLEETSDGRLSFSIDPEVLDLSMAGRYYAVLSWQTDNPFKGGTGDPDDYAASLSMELECGGGGLVQVQMADSEGNELLSQAVGTQAVLDNSIPLTSSGGSTVIAVNDTDEQLTVRAMVMLTQDASSAAPSCTLGAFGIGLVDECYVPYGYMSGTSMATPLIAGAYAQLASAFPQESALELRGRLLGATDALEESVDASGETKHIATDGRFTFEKAFDESSLNATTWGIEVDVETGAAVLHGRSLNGAQLVVDGEPVSAEAQDEGYELAFSVSASKLDGGLHEFEVIDAASGRSHRAVYSLPQAQDKGLVSIDEVAALPALPGDASQGTLIASADTLFYADRTGSFLYSIDPDCPEDGWRELAAPGRSYATTPGADVAGSQTLISYGYLDGKIYALGFDAREGSAGDDIALFQATYDIADDTWSDYQEVARVPASFMSELSVERVLAPVAYRGSLELAAVIERASSFGGSSDTLYRFELDAAEGTWGCTELPLADDDAQPFALVSSDELHLVSVSSGGASEIRTQLDDGTWSDAMPASNFPDLTESSLADLFKSVTFASGSGLVLAGRPITGFGTLGALDVEGASWSGLGTLSAGTFASPVIGAGAMLGDTVYLCALDMDADAPIQGSLVALDRTATSALGSVSAQASVRVEGCGSAQVADWRESGSSAVSSRLHDTVTFSAQADTGYRFVGWFDGTGALVSKDASFSSSLLGDMQLTARFEQDGSGSSQDGNEGTDPDGGTDEPSVDGDNDESSVDGGQDEDDGLLAQTGDTVLPLLLVCLGAATITFAAVVALRCRR